MPITCSQIQSQNSAIACKPPPSLAIQGKTANGFKTAAQKTQLMELEVVFEGAIPHGPRGMWFCPPGSKVLVNYENTHQEWMKRAFELDGKEFILVPSQYILLTRSIPWQEPTPEELNAIRNPVTGGVMVMGTNNAALTSEQRPTPATLPPASDGVTVGTGG